MGAPDIVGIQEIESAMNKSEIFATIYEGKTFESHLRLLGYRFFEIGKQDPENPVSVTTAIISKIPVKSLPSIIVSFGNYNPSARDIQVVESDFGKDRLLIFNGHWKSKAGDFTSSEEQRILTAKLIKERIKKEKAQDPRVKIIVMGDLNTAYFEEPLVELGETSNEADMLAEPNDRLFNLWYELDEKERWEHSFNGIRSTLSHILISDSLYTEDGFHYVNDSFEVIGHKLPQKEKLIGVNGLPFRWQIRNFFNFSEHIGEGFSDHLPLVAHFTYKPYGAEATPKARKLKIENPSGEPTIHAPTKLFFDEVPVCSAEEGTDLRKISLKNIKSYIGKCVFFEVPAGQAALTLKTRGKYKESYFEWSPMPDARNERSMTYDDSKTLGLTMTRAYDWRPNIDDKRVTLSEASIPDGGSYSSKNPHPKSNMCFQRKLLQGSAVGSLRYAKGRLGYDNGYLSLHIAVRQDIRLENFETVERNASCLWE